MLANLSHVEPPRGHEIEIRTIAALIHLGEPSNVRVQMAMLKLNTACFAVFDHRFVFDLIQELFYKGQSFDLVQIMSLIGNDQHHLIESAVREEYLFCNHLESDIEKLIAYRTWRNALVVMVNAVNRSLEHYLPEDSLLALREEIQLLNSPDDARSNSVIRTYEEEIDAMLCESEDEVVDFPINIAGLPNVPVKSMITIAGRSGHGKTFFAIYFMDAIIDAFPDKQTLYFNLEMHPRVMIERHALLIGATGDNRKELFKNAAPKLLSKNVSLISVPMITIEQIESECRLAALIKPLCCVVVDYIGLVGSKAKYESKTIQQNDIAKRLAALSIELNCVVIPLVQVNREAKTRRIGDRCPLTTDAAEAMGTVNSSSWWLGIDQPQNDDDSGEYQDLFMVACRKNRGSGGLFTQNFSFKNGRFSKYYRPFSPKTSAPDGF